MKLNELLDKEYKSIVIQCHNDPDADTVASGYALYCYFKQYVKDIKLVYGGYHEIIKSNMVAMVREFDIPIIYLNTLETIPDLLITVDCQYGERNVASFEGETVAVIDHHKFNRNNTRASYVHVKDTYGSCSTVVWEMLREVGSDLVDDKRIATLLYYGLYMDTCQLKEIYHLKDRIMRDKLFNKYDEVKLRLLQNNNISFKELKDVIGPAYLDAFYNSTYKYILTEVKSCDPNILGLVSDQILQVNNTKVAVAFCEIDVGYKISIRSCALTEKASDIVRYITFENGGGNDDKAGGILFKDNVMPGIEIKDYLINRLNFYFCSFYTLNIDTNFNLEYFEVFKKKQVCLGYCPISDIYEVGSKIKVISLEGDSVLCVTDDLCIMVGVNSEVYYCSKSYLIKYYDICDELHTIESEREHLLLQDCVISLTCDQQDYTRELFNCYAKPNVEVYAKRLNDNVKILAMDKCSYFSGKSGDYLVFNKNERRCHIVNSEIFDKLYERADSVR